MTVRVRVGGLAYGGSFVGQILDGPPESIGKKAFIPFVAPGELVTAKIELDEKRFCVASVAEIIERSAERIEAPCPYFTICGGCELQHLPIAKQRELKRSMIETSLKAHGNVLPKNGVRDMSAGLPDYSYRRRITLHLDQDGKLGFYRANSHNIISIDRCVISTAAINSALPVLHEYAQHLCGGVSEIILEENNGVITAQFISRDEKSAPFDLPSALKEQFSTVAFSASGAGSDVDNETESTIGHFSQINAAGNEVLVNSVLEWVSTDKVTDLYAGAGNFSIPLAERNKNVTAVELDSALAVHGMKLAIEKNVDANVKFFATSCEHFLQKNNLASTVVLDPPRAGAGEIVRQISPKRTHEVIYVSCSLPTLTRDLKVLIANGYSVIETRFVDMFAQTHHVEMVTLLRAV